ncbi:fumarate reductase subunit D [Labrenzia sp. EL_195]|nr:fumarate reductase subunit D [Labrenzia sp. EL_195]
MTLILLAVSLTIMLCVLAFNFAIYALPVMAGIVAFQQFHASGVGFGLSAFGALCSAFLSLILVIAVLGFVKSPIVRLIALGIFAVPAAIAGYALAHGLAKSAVDSAIVLNLLCGTSGLIVAIAAMINLLALGEDVLSR